MKENEKHRCVIFDVESTGFNAGTDRIVEVGAIELIDRKPTGAVFHEYVDPHMEVPESAVAVHGLTRSDLIERGNGQSFKDIASRFESFIKGATLVAHNASFDMSFIDFELKTAGLKAASSYATVVDTLKLAKAAYPGSRNTLDALCRRLGVDNSNRDFHGALLDSELLVDVYLNLTRKQEKIFDITAEAAQKPLAELSVERLPHFELPIPALSDNERMAHKQLLGKISKSTGRPSVYEERYRARERSLA